MGTVGGIPRYLLNSVVVSLGAVVLAISVGSFAAYSFVRYENKYTKYFLLVLTSARLLPSVVLIFPIYMMYKTLGLYNTWLGLIIAYGTFNLPVSIFLLMSYFQELPREIEEASMVDGCTDFQALIRIALPLAAPGLVATAIMCLVWSWNEFLFAFILTSSETRTFPAMIPTLTQEEATLWGEMIAASLIAVLPIILFTTSVQKYLVRGLTAGAVKN
jgi:multiple sugar transport system permease protein